MTNVRYFFINLWEAILFFIMPKEWMREYFTIDWESPEGEDIMKRLVKYPRGFERRLSTLSTEELHNAIIEYRKIISR